MANCEIKNPPEFTVEVEKWNRETLADGAAMGAEMEKLLNNTYYNKSQTEQLEEGKVSSNGGDISETTVKTLEAPQEEFPIPQAGEGAKTFFGKVKKNLEDWKNFKDGIITLGKLVNNGQCTEPGFALDARFGKELADRLAVLNTNLTIVIGDDSIVRHPDQVLKNQWNSLPIGSYTIRIGCSAEYGAYVYKLSNVYGTATIWSYIADEPIQMLKLEIGVWHDYKYVLDSDLLIVSIYNESFAKKLSTDYVNKATPFVFFNPTDNPFSFSQGYGIAFNGILLQDSKQFTLFAISQDGTATETKLFKIA